MDEDRRSAASRRTTRVLVISRSLPNVASATSSRLRIVLVDLLRIFVGFFGGISGFELRLLIRESRQDLAQIIRIDEILLEDRVRVFFCGLIGITAVATLATPS